MPDLQEHPTHRLSSIASIIRPSCPPYKRGGRVVDENFSGRNRWITEYDHGCGQWLDPEANAAGAAKVRATLAAAKESSDA